jgi:8-hydroxy-5-deazaflavin:NADPH oxidoreductase
MSGMVTTLGIIGSGHVGGTIARLARNAGYDVVLSNSRGPETLADTVAELGTGARAAWSDQAAREADLVVVSVPLKAFGALPATALDGKVVLDTCNYYPERDGRLVVLETEKTTTSELLQSTLRGSQVVKAFSNINYLHLAMLGRPPGDPQRGVLPIAGDDESAKDAAVVLLDAVGWDAFDVGPLAEGWRFQRDTPAYVMPYDADGLTYWPPRRGRRVTAEVMAELIASAKRYRDM